jgi:NTP pyrophosphatase (non-canonical NTP hydrolase)
MGKFDDLMSQINEFANARDWDQFHSPKNLAMALAAEAGELLAEFQWLTEEQSKALDSKKKQQVQDEIGDVIIYTLRLCGKLNIDPYKAATEKIKKNAVKYPVAKAKGNAKKYRDL